MFIKDKKLFKQIIEADLYRYDGNTSAKAIFKNLLLSPGFRFTFLLRKASYYKNRGLGVKHLIYRLLLAKYQYKYGFQISSATQIGRGLYLGHFGTVVVSSKAVIGENVNLSPGVTIGVTRRGKNEGAPVIGNKVWVGANAIIVGKIKIGDNVMIAPGAYVNFDVPDNAVVMGNPGKIVSYKGTEGYINRVME
jgi:serine O-acetyltransferase